MSEFRSALITGGGSGLAHAFSAALKARQYACYLMPRKMCDGTSIAAVGKWCDKLKPGLIVNCAAMTGIDQCQQDLEHANAVNCDGAAILASLARHYGIALIHIGCAAIFPGDSATP